MGVAITFRSVPQQQIVPQPPKPQMYACVARPSPLRGAPHLLYAYHGYKYTYKYL